MHIFIIQVYFSGIHDLRPHVNDEQYHCLMDFTSMESESEIEDFSEWVAEMGKPQVISLLLVSITLLLVLLLN